MPTYPVKLSLNPTEERIIRKAAGTEPLATFCKMAALQVAHNRMARTRRDIQDEDDTSPPRSMFEKTTATRAMVCRTCNRIIETAERFWWEPDGYIARCEACHERWADEAE